MTAQQATILLKDIRTAKKNLAEMSSSQRKTLEKSWDVEHAYYSSSLEGSKLNRKEFEKIGKNIK